MQKWPSNFAIHSLRDRSLKESGRQWWNLQWNSQWFGVQNFSSFSSSPPFHDYPWLSNSSLCLCGGSINHRVMGMVRNDLEGLQKIQWKCSQSRLFLSRALSLSIFKRLTSRGCCSGTWESLSADALLQRPCWDQIGTSKVVCLKMSVPSW